MTPEDRAAIVRAIAAAERPGWRVGDAIGIGRVRRFCWEVRRTRRTDDGNGEVQTLGRYWFRWRARRAYRRAVDPRREVDLLVDDVLDITDDLVDEQEAHERTVERYRRLETAARAWREWWPGRPASDEELALVNAVDALDEEATTTEEASA